MIVFEPGISKPKRTQREIIKNLEFDEQPKPD